MKETVLRIPLVLLGALCLWSFSSAKTSPEHVTASPKGVGVLVIQIEQGGEAKAAGIEIGDQIVEWSVGANSRTIESPFDWGEMVVEQAPRGTIALRGLRHEQERAWTLGLQRWGVAVEPIFPERLAKEYELCRGLRAAERQKEASVCWESLSGQVESGDPPWLGRFISGQLAESLSKQQRWLEADRAYQQAVGQGRAEGNIPLAQALEAWSVAKRMRGDLEPASKYCSETLEIRRALAPQSLAVAHVLSICGDIERARDGVEKAEQSYTEALKIRQKLAPGSMDEADSLGNIGTLAYVRGDLAKCEEYHNRALALRENLAPDSVSVANSLVPLGVVAWRRGELVVAEKFLIHAHDIFERQSPGSFSVSATVNNMGLIALSRGDLASAEDDFREALAVQEKLAPGSLDVASKLGNLAIVAERRGDLAMAEDYQNRALDIREKLGARMGVAQSLDVLGEIALERHDLERAETNFHKALTVWEELAPGSELMAGTLHSLGQVAKDRGDLAKAEQYYLQAFEIQEKVAPSGEMVAGTLGELGAVARSGGKFSKAEAYLTRSLAIEEKLAPGSQDHAKVLHELGLLLRAEGNLEKAGQYMAAAVDAVEHQTTRLGGGTSTLAEFRAQQAYYYKDLMEIQLRSGQTDRAFLTAERSRAQSLLAMLAERDLLIDKDLPVEILQARKTNASAYDETLNELSKLNPTKDAARVEQLSTRLRELNREREQLIDSARKASPRYADLRYPKPLGPVEASNFLDPGTILASFLVCDDRTVLFVIESGGAQESLSVFNLPVGEKALRNQVQEFRKLILEKRTAKDTVLVTSAKGLYDELFRPAESILSRGERVLVIPDGPLHLLPFAALMRDSGTYLAEWKPLSTVVSATLFAELKTARRTQEKAVELVAFGDPRYPNNDNDKGTLNSRADVEIRNSMERGLKLGRLPFSRIEVEKLATLYPNRSERYLGEEATEERAKSIGNEVRYIHFAVHGLLDQRFPLNSALVLSIPEKAAPGKDNGLLQAWEIFDQMRIDADLVTLSACNSGLGEELNGEGLVGLTRAFQYAGAHSILASLWSVDDLRTMELMTELYAQLHQDATKEKALRLAQLKLLHSKTAAAPYYWAGFVLTGDWR